MATLRQFPISPLSRALLATVASACIVSATPALAQHAVLGTIIIQADRSPMQREQMGRSLTVIDAKQLEISKAPYIADVLRQVPGLAVSSSGSVGSLSQVRIRGGEANHTLVMIDGVVANSASDGDFDFGRLQIAEVERIEVLRGPQGAFWGSNAISGVINIVTKPGIRSGLRTTLGTEFGSDGTKMGSALLQYGQDNFTWSGSVTSRQTDGFNISSIGDEKDGAQHFDANFKFRADISPSVTLDGNLRYANTLAEGDNEVSFGVLNDSGDTTRTSELLGSLGGRWTNEDASWFQTARFSANQVDQLFQGGAWGDSDATTRRYKGSYQLGHRFYTPDLLNAEHTITGGYDLTQETYKSSYDADMFTRSSHAFTGEYRGRFANQFYLTAALRHDLNDRFEDFTSYSLSSAWQIPEAGTRLHASLGTGSSNPSFYEQFYGGSSTFTPNPNLRPEQSFAWDIGVEQSLFGGQLIVDATYFNQRLEDLIKTASSSGTSTVINLPGISTRQGLELTGTLDFLNGFVASASYTYTHARTADGEIEVRRPAHVGVVNLRYTLEDIPLTLHTSASFVGEAKDSDWSNGGLATIPAFTDLSAGLNYKVNENVEVYGRVTNILNTANQTVYGFNSPGRTYYVGAKASF
ncbi:TonB-dependent receptor [Devosia sp. MC521]|uniref:TonB-dependent receptor plug domain-containing protein n=1 Tax=Devosia sp. MC521 TaxID=2759954 RepID=UPI0015F7C8F1|nr:TonB-dependent receptor [Devosia sp. MC521]MBJ6986781.1 TonB-dependent receptor [Devosia sp. MC521]QMW63816.1 TonB-dependent receptor [Devosia sp. MC521]